MPGLPTFDFSFFLPTYVPAKTFFLDNKSLQEKMIQAFLRKSVGEIDSCFEGQDLYSHVIKTLYILPR